MDKSLKTKTIKGFVWKLSEKFGAQVVSFVVSIILARLITPEDFGTVSIIMIFIAFLNVFVDAGFGSALIQKKNADILDFSTITYFSFASSIIFYIILFFCAPLIAKLYGIPQLTILLRVMGVRIIFAGYNSVQSAYIAKKMLFKKYFFITSIGTLISAVVGVVMAYLGYGVWALITQYLVNTFCDTVLLSLLSKLKLKLVFSFKRLRGMLKFSVGILGAGLIDTTYNEIRSIIIGIKYTRTDLAEYNRAISIPNLLGDNIDGTLGSVMFPMLVNFQDDKVKLKSLLKKYMCISSYLLMPIYVGLALIAHNLIIVLYTETWIACVPYMQIACFAYIFNPINNGNLQIFKVMGKSNIVFWTNIIKKVFYTLTILIAMNYGVIWIAVAIIPINIFAIIVNSFPSKKLFNYGLGEQMLSMLPNLIPTVIMGIAVYLVGLAEINIYLSLFLQILTGVLTYFFASILLKNKGLKMCLDLLKSFKRARKVKNDNGNNSDL